MYRHYLGVINYGRGRAVGTAYGHLLCNLLLVKVDILIAYEYRGLYIASWYCSIKHNIY